MSLIVSRRHLLRGGGAALGALALAGCDPLEPESRLRGVLESAETLTMKSQRLLLGRDSLAREFGPQDLSPIFKANGSVAPDTAFYRSMQAAGFASWRIQVGGLVTRPLDLSLEAIRQMPARTQITRHDCVEGWSAIGKWTGVPLAFVLAMARPRESARYVMFHCADNLGRTDSEHGDYYESIDLIDARHPQTILAYRMNDAPLSVAHGAPLRLRVERQLGYKHAKYIKRIELVSSLAGLGRGKGGFWPDRGYEWYAGI